MGTVYSVHQPQYLPWLGYFDKIAKSDIFVFLDKVQYKPREFQNRNKIRTKDGWKWLTVPVVSKGRYLQNISDAVVDNDIDWARQHLKSLETSYGRSEFFRGHIGFFEETYSTRWERLMDLNIHITNHIKSKLGIDTKVFMESAIGTEKSSTERIIEIGLKLKADTYLSGAGGRDYLDEKRFDEAGIKLLYQNFNHPVYRQQFASGAEDFIPYMSAVDLLFNEGGNSKGILLG